MLRQSPDLERLAVAEIRPLLESARVGAALPIPSGSELCNVLEFVIPQTLRHDHPEWETGSLGGLYISRAIHADETIAELEGICILITDQCVTALALRLGIAPLWRFQPFQIRLGERGAGLLGISGPKAGSTAASVMFSRAASRRAEISWVYDSVVR